MSISYLALLPGLDTHLLHTQRLTETRDPCKDLTTTRETLVVDCNFHRDSNRARGNTDVKLIPLGYYSLNHSMSLRESRKRRKVKVKSLKLFKEEAVSKAKFLSL